MSPADSTASASDLGITQRRKPHKKSKNGCADCKRRRVKCNEGHPACRSCLRHGIPCVYPPHAQTGVESPSLPPLTRGDSTRRSSQSVQPDLGALGGRGPVAISSFLADTAPSHCGAPTFTLNDLGLLHHWTAFTSRNIVCHPPLDLLWQVTVPEIAAQHEFLMRSILCLSALHLAHEKGHMRTSFIQEAAFHHNLAIQGFNVAIGEMSEENSDALFAFSTLNILCVFGRYRPLGDDMTEASRRNTKDHILGLDWVNMMRGISVVLKPIHRVVWSGPLRILLDTGNWDDLSPDDAIGGSVGHLRETQSAWRDSSDAQLYDETLGLLIKSFMFVEQFNTVDQAAVESWGHNRAWAGPMLFLHYAPENFFVRVKQRQPPALIIMVYLGVAFHGLRDFWFMEGWGKDIVQVVDDILGDYWRPWTSWPLEVVQSR